MDTYGHLDVRMSSKTKRLENMPTSVFSLAIFVNHKMVGKKLLKDVVLI